MFTLIVNIYIFILSYNMFWIGWLVEFYNISTFLGYLNSNPLYTCILKKKLAAGDEGVLKAPFIIATTQRRKGGQYSIPWIAPLYS